jgi:hypothetical protein
LHVFAGEAARIMSDSYRLRIGVVAVRLGTGARGGHRARRQWSAVTVIVGVNAGRFSKVRFEHVDARVSRFAVRPQRVGNARFVRCID